MAEGPTTLLEVQHMLIESAADLRRELDGQGGGRCLMRWRRVER